MILLPRQARDKHREKHSKRDQCVFRRLFGDRMVTPDAKQRVATMLQGVAQTQFHANVDIDAMFVTWGSMQEATGKKTASSALPFCTKNAHFIKTGSGQT
jgi:hypothetical protein